MSEVIITHSKWIGSFQTGYRYESENPVEEVWSRIARLGAATALRDGLCNSVETSRADQVARYAALRIRQAVEFRQATRSATVLTAPLTLYYSFLNLVRVLLSLSTAEEPSRKHGLGYSAAPNLFDTAAIVQAEGTLTDYLRRNGVSVRKGLRITLKDALARIIELLHDRSLPTDVTSLGVSIAIDAPRGGPLLLTFPKSLDTFRDNWSQEFPSLAGNCILEPTGNVLWVDGEDLSTYEAIAKFLNRVLQTDLRERQTPVWYALRVVDPELVFPREAYYMIALFILGSIVRYEPEMMLEASNPDAEVGWFLRRFLHVAERYFPQLMLMWIEQCPIYFSSAV